jgi:hypothetical protein
VLRPAWDFLPLLEAVVACLERFAGFAADAGLPLSARARSLSQYLPASLTEGAALLQLLEVRGMTLLYWVLCTLQYVVSICCIADSVHMHCNFLRGSSTRL